MNQTAAREGERYQMEKRTMKHRLDPPTTYYDGTLTIRTLEGDMTANKGDWIIKGVQGEFYPCKPDIFAATYEPVQ